MQRLKTWLEIKKWLALTCFVAAFAIVWALPLAESGVASDISLFRAAEVLVAAGFLIAVWAMRDQLRLCRMKRLVARRRAAAAAEEYAAQVFAAEKRRRAAGRASLLRALQPEDSRQAAA